MDVGLTVGNLAMITAVFATMSYIALSVELGLGPKAKPKSLKSTISELFKSKKSKAEKVESSQNTDSVKVEDITESQKAAEAMNLEHTVTSSDAMTDGVARSELDEKSSGSNLDSLRARFIDGFIGPRVKYDVALTVLYESQNKKVLKPDEGTDVATQAFLEATQSVVFTES